MLDGRKESVEGRSFLEWHRDRERGSFFPLKAGRQHERLDRRRPGLRLGCRQQALALGRKPVFQGAERRKQRLC